LLDLVVWHPDGLDGKKARIKVERTAGGKIRISRFVLSGVANALGLIYRQDDCQLRFIFGRIIDPARCGGMRRKHNLLRALRLMTAPRVCGMLIGLCD